MSNSLTSYPSDVSDEEWAFVAPYLTLMREDAPQRDHTLRAVFNALRWMVRALAPAAARLSALAGGLPANPALAGRRLLRGGGSRSAGRAPSGRRSRARSQRRDFWQPHPAIQPGARAGYDGYKRRKGVHAAVDTHLLAAHVTPANEQDRVQVAELAGQVQAVTDDHVELAFVDQGYTGEQPAAAARDKGIRLEVVKLPETRKGFVLLPRRWVVERFFAWTARFRRLARDYERLPETLAGLHFVAFACLMLARIGDVLT
jgi:transposase